MDFTDLWVVFDAEVDARVKAIDQRGAHCRLYPLDQQANEFPTVNFFRVIGRPTDRLAFARSDGSGRHERGVLGF